MKSEELAAYLEVVQELGAFKPVVKNAIEQIKLYSEEFNQLQDFLINKGVEGKTKMFKGFVDNGFSREEAMILTLDSVEKYKQAFSNVKKSK